MKTYTLTELAAIEGVTASLEYSTAGADALTLSGLSPAWVDKLGWSRWEHIILTDDGGTPLFCGTVTQGREMAAQGGSAPRATFTAQSDWALLEQTAYTHVNAEGMPALAARWTSSTSKTPTASLLRVLDDCFACASNWSGSRMMSTLSCTLDGESIPVSQSGGSSCAQLMLSALDWSPDAVIRMGYAAASASGSGLVMHIDESTSLAPVIIDKTARTVLCNGQQMGTHRGIADVSLRPRPDLVLPAAALIGAQHFSIGGDLRSPGAFVYCVTRQAPAEGDTPATDDPNKKKTIISGLRIPPRTNASARGYWLPKLARPETHKLLAHCFPFLGELGTNASGFGNYYTGAPLLSIVLPENLRPADMPTDKDAAAVPDNYDPTFISTADRVFVHIDGAFPASARASRNIPGLKWCKGELRVMVALNARPANVPIEAAKSFFSGLYKASDGSPWRYAELTIGCTFINASRRIVKGTKPLENDPEYTPEEVPEPEPSYVRLLTDYFNATQTLCHEGSLTLLEPTLRPEDVLGRRVRVQGMHPEWEGMTAICRSVSYDLMSRRMTLNLGSRDVMGWDMRIEREQLSREREQNARAVAPLVDLLSPAPTDEEGEEEKEADVLMVEPSISAKLSTSAVGQRRRPWECYYAEEEDADGNAIGVWTMQGGSVWVGNTEIKIETTACTVTAGEATETPLDPTKKTRRRIYQHVNKSGQLEWTYDIYQTN